MGEELKAGRDLDAIVGEKVMGLKGVTIKCPKCDCTVIREHWLVGTMTCKDCEYNLDFAGNLNIPIHYSTDISDAWKIVEKLGLFNKWLFGRHQTADTYVVYNYNDESWERISESKSAPHAICLAALKAVSNG